MRTAALVRNWWLLATRGALAILFGLAILVWPDVNLPFIVVFFGVYAALDGLWALGIVVLHPHGIGGLRDTWPIALEGLVSFGLGCLALGSPLVSREFIHVLVAWGIFTGGLEVIAGLLLPREASAHWLLGTAGVLSVFLAVLVFMLPRADSALIAHVIGGYAVVFGIVLTLAAARFRRPRPAHHAVAGRA